MDAFSETPPLADGPPKPHRTHHRRSKIGSDPFHDLDNDALKESSSLATGKEASDPADPPRPLLTDLVLTPLNMISFILSLTMIDYQQRQWRLSQHATGQETFWFRLTHWSWLQPEPYQDSRDGTWKHNDKATSQNAPTSTFQGWHTQKKHRAMAKMAINDAFDFRGRVLVALLAWAVLVVAGLSYAARRIYGYASGL